MYLPNLEELSFLIVFALPNDSKTGFVRNTLSSNLPFVLFVFVLVGIRRFIVDYVLFFIVDVFVLNIA